MKNLDLYKNNYEKLWESIERHMIKWNKSNLSLLDRIVVAKMNILSRVFIFLSDNTDCENC